MNFNHLMETALLKRKCTVNNGECYWIPVGNGRSTHGNNVHLTMYCRHCALREDIFLTKQDYEIQERLILQELQNAHAR